MLSLESILSSSRPYHIKVGSAKDDAIKKALKLMQVFVIIKYQLITVDAKFQGNSRQQTLYKTLGTSCGRETYLIGYAGKS